eukprot:3539012-Prymnesium_polylepis.1
MSDNVSDLSRSADVSAVDSNAAGTPVGDESHEESATARIVARRSPLTMTPPSPLPLVAAPAVIGAAVTPLRPAKPTRSFAHGPVCKRKRDSSCNCSACHPKPFGSKDPNPGTDGILKHGEE